MTNLSVRDLEQNAYEAVKEQLAKYGEDEFTRRLCEFVTRMILGPHVKQPEAGYPKTLTKRYRNDSLLSMSDRMKGAAGYGEATRIVNSAEEEKRALEEEGFGGGLKSAHYPLTLKLSAIPGGAPAQEIIVRSPQEELDALIHAEQEGRKVIAV